MPREPQPREARVAWAAGERVSDAIDADFREAPSTALAVVRDERPPALFGTDDPVEVVQRAVRVADALKAVVVSKNLIANIQGKQYPQVEAWLTLAAMLRLTTVCEWSRPVPGGWEARVFVRDASGATVGAAEAQCLSSERSKKGWEDYALRSMAQTRATSKSLRSVLGFVMVLAGYEATPIEEMPGDPTPKPGAPPGATHPRGKTLSEARADQAREAWRAVHGTGDLVADDAAFLAFARGKTPTQILALLAEKGGEANVVQAWDSAGSALHGLHESGASSSNERAPASAEERTPPPETIAYDAPRSEAQHAKMMALHTALYQHDAQRHEVYAAVTNGRVRSSKELTMGEAHDVIDYLQATLNERNAAAAKGRR